ncbi:MAG: phosphotransferase, partial [Gemmatimonadetes bacterium]|nr:phosphotransferase [Gemmatimonadota bacterium]
RPDVETSEGFAGFSGALVLRLSSPGGFVALRGWPADSLSRERILGLHRLLAEVHAAGVTQVPVPFATLDGTTLIEAGRRWWQLEPWMPGLADFHARPGSVRLHSAMRCLARFHRAAARFEPQWDETQWFRRKHDASAPAVRERLERVEQWNAGGFQRLKLAVECDDRQDDFHKLALAVIVDFPRLAPGIGEALRAAAEVRVPLQPCIRDVWHDHVLFTGDDVTGLIDLSACRTDTVAADLSRLLGSLVGDNSRDWDAALAAYQAERPLALDELALAPILDRSGVLLAAMRWLERRYLQQNSVASDARVCQRLERLAGRLRQMS